VRKSSRSRLLDRDTNVSYNKRRQHGEIFPGPQCVGDHVPEGEPVFEKIDENVEALVFFTMRGMKVHSFQWNNRSYRVERITMAHKVREGSEWLYYYAIFSGASTYRLCFSTRTLRWKLLDVYCEG
jgi:hypothetical protein